MGAPWVLQAAGDKVKWGGRILAVQWTGDESGALANGNIASIRGMGTGDLLWFSRYPDSVGINAGPSGFNSGDGFYVDRLDAGRILVYPREE